MPLRTEPDPRHADWWARRKEPWEVLCTVGPSGFASYAQVLMPFDDDDDRTGPLPSVEGNLDDRTLASVLEVAAAHTTTPEDAFSCLWDGWGGVPPGSRVRLPNREFLLFRGPLADARAWALDLVWIPPPAAVWPADRAWFLAFDVDPDWACLGGSDAVVTALVADHRLQARRVAWGPLEDPRERAR